MSFRNPGLDILIPHYNDPEGLRISLETVQAQDYEGPLRVVVIDDGSDAERRNEAERITKDLEDNRIHPVFSVNAQNRGRPFTRNRLLESVESDWVAWLDAGDLWYPEKTTLQMERFTDLEEKGVEVDRVWMTCDYAWRWQGGQAKHITQQVAGDQLKELLTGQLLRAYLWTLICPKKSLALIGPFDERLPRLQDLDYFLRFVEAGGILAKPSFIQQKSLCRYEKSDIGRNAKEIHKCNALISEKHRFAINRYGTEFARELRIQADLHSQRFARNNQDKKMAAYFKFRAALRNPPAAILRELKRLGL